MAKKTKPLPEVICLSDGDDDHDDPNELSTPVKNEPSKMTNGIQKTDLCPVSDWSVQRKDIARIPDLSIKRTDLIKQSIEIRCTLICFGIVEFHIESDTILMSNTEFEFKLQSSSMENLNIKLAYSDILKFFYSYQSQPPAAFIQVRSEFAELFDKYIPSSDEHGKKFDPNAKDEKRRRIILYLEPLTSEMESIQISSIYYYLKAKAPSMNVCCVNGARAQELFNLSRCENVSQETPLLTPFIVDEKLLTPRTVGLNQNTIKFDLSIEDLKCLNEGEFLNDTIIDFYLQYVYHEILSEEDRRRTYLFNSFFYTRLTRKTNDDVSTVSAAERRYSRVKRWLRDVDIFSKDFLIVPINQTAHWFIVLIQYHNQVPTEADLISDDDDDDDQPLREKTSAKPMEIAEIPSSPSKTRSKTPAIVMFDSLRSGAKNRVSATLREFLQMEYDHKKPLPKDSSARKIFNADTISAIEAAVPQQPNYFDCGLYILQYIESFFSHRSPTINFQSASTFADWCETNSMGSSKRKQIFQIINQHTIAKVD